MSIRTIEAPGVEIKEIDKSQYAPAMTGTKVLTFGFANKGEDYEPMQFTSRSSWLLYYGDPDNEAERYFYNACMEVINQNGVLYCCKLPYENEAKDKYAFKKYTITTKASATEINSVDAFVANNNLTDLLDGQYKRYGYNPNQTPEVGASTQTSSFYAQSILKIESDTSRLNEYNKEKHLKDTKLRLYWDYTTTEEDDNWNYYAQTNIVDRMKVLFDRTEYADVWTKLEAKASVSRNNLQLSSLREIAINDNGVVFIPGQTEPTADQYISAFMTGYEQVFGVDSDGYGPMDFEPWTFVYAKFQTNETSSLFVNFFSDNADMFHAFQNISKDVDNAEISNLTPYIYWEAADKTNMMSYYTAAVDVTSVGTMTDEELQSIVSRVDGLVWYNNETKVYDNLSALSAQYPTYSCLSANFASLKTTDGKYGLNTSTDTSATNYVKTVMTGDIITQLVNEMTTFKSSDLYEEIAASFTNEPAVSNSYVKAIIAYYLENVNVTDYWDNNTLKNATTMVGFNQVHYIAPGETQSEEDAPLIDVSFFERYGNVIDEDTGLDIDGEFESITKSVDNLMKYYNKKVLSKGSLLSYITEIKSSAAFAAVSAIAIASDEKLAKFDEVSAVSELKYSEIRTADSSISSYLTIKSTSTPGMLDITAVDEYRTGESAVPPNSMYVVDITRSKYAKAADIDETECIGIIPVITTAANALYAQSLIDVGDADDNAYLAEAFNLYNCLSTAYTIGYENRETGYSADSKELDSAQFAKPFFSVYSADETVSQDAASFFSAIQFKDDGSFDRESMTKIGVVVFKAYLDATEGNKISFNAVESFCGDLDKYGVNPNTGATTFIDTIVNSQSEYINFFSNCFNTTGTRKEYNENTDIIFIEPQSAGSLGFYEDMCVEDISLTKSIYDGLAKSFDKNQDINEKDIDIVVDGGISNIAQYIKTVFNGKGQYDPTSTEAAMFKLKTRGNTLIWRDIISKYDTFCKSTRKDCMFIADGLRPLCLTGNQKIVRPSKPSNTIDANILPVMKYLTGINTSYGAGYCDWFKKADEFTGDLFWCPPSIQACGIYIYTDSYYQYWDAPAGLNRGIVNALDVAFSPTNAQAGAIYTKSWNYAINYPYDGIVLEGQKTFQVKPSAFDRVNVRRLFLRLERQTYKVARYFVYEGNTAYTRQRFVDTITPIFETAKLGGGIYDYKIICDESINTADVIDNNEMRVKIGIKPVKTAEFILIDFIALSTGGSFSEM